MLIEKYLLIALAAIGSVTASSDSSAEGAIAAERRCNNDRWAYWDDKGRGCSCRSGRRWDSRRQHCY